MYVLLRSTRFAIRSYVGRKNQFLLKYFYYNKVMNTQISSMISACEIINYLVKDTLVDFLRYRDRSFSTPDDPTGAREPSCSNCFEGFIKNVGITFEKRLVEHLSKKHNVVSVASVITDESCRHTVALMKRGVKIIHVRSRTKRSC